MIIDTDNQLITFSHETLCVHELRSMVALLEFWGGDVELEETHGITPDEALAELREKLSFDPNKVRLVKAVDFTSFSSLNTKYVVVELSDETFACSCPDWIYRHDLPENQHEEYGYWCKHIMAALNMGLM